MPGLGFMKGLGSQGLEFRGLRDLGFTKVWIHLRVQGLGVYGLGFKGIGST